MFDEIVVIRSGGDIGTAVAHKLFRSGFKVLILETNMPLAIRRRVAFCEAVYDGEASVEGIKCKRINNVSELKNVFEEGAIPLMVDELGSVISEIKAEIVVDAILAKRNINTSINMAPLTIGLGPGFKAGVDVKVVIETNRGHDLGRLIYKGEAEKNTGIPGVIAGYGKERVLRAPCDGLVKVVKGIGELTCVGDTILVVGGEEVRTVLSGVVRGCIREGIMAEKGLKIGDVDPRGNVNNCFTMSDKARCIAGGVLEAILYYKQTI